MSTAQAAPEVLYDVIESRLCIGEDSLTAEQARELLGWTVEPEDKKFNPDDIHLRDGLKRAVHCSNAVKHQRRFYTSHVTALFWEILAGNWHFNGKNVIVGQQGTVLDGKHRLAALVLADEEYQRNPERYPFWSQSPPSIDTALLFGVEETVQVSNTIDSGKSRTLADSIYAAGMFNEFNKSEKNRLGRTLEYAVRLLWERTGAKKDAYSPRLSHSEAFDFVDRHPKLIECVKAVFLEDDQKERKLSRYVPLGSMAGFMYLMATRNSKGVKAYADAAEPSEAVLGELESYDKADAFIAALAGKDKELAPLHAAFARMDEAGTTDQAMRAALLSKGWQLYADDQKLTPAQLKVESKVEDGQRILLDDHVFGGIDQGSSV